MFLSFIFSNNNKSFKKVGRRQKKERDPVSGSQRSVASANDRESTLFVCRRWDPLF